MGERVAKSGEAWRFARQASLVEDGSACVLWPFSRNDQGYGKVWHPLFKRLTYAHRTVLEMAIGPAPSEQHEVAHDPVLCSSRLCVNPRHLRWATSVENNADKQVAGTKQWGDDHPQSKLTDADIDEIMTSYTSNQEMAARFGVNVGYVSRLRHGKAERTEGRVAVVVEENWLRTRGKVSDEAVVEIYESSDSAAALAARFGLGEGYVRSLRNGHATRVQRLIREGRLTPRSGAAGEADRAAS